MKPKVKTSLSIILYILIATISFLLWHDDSSTNLMLKKQPKPTNDFWLQNDDILLFLEAVTQFNNHDLYLKPEVKRRELVQETLRSVVERLDPYAAYMTANEFSQWKKSQGDQYAGIGMEILKNSLGQVICLPYPDSPAAKAGIQTGDKLISIDGESVHGRSILALSAIAGNQGESVRLSIMGDTKEQKHITVKRSRIAFNSVSISRIANIDVIKISAFTSDTKAKLRDALTNFSELKPLVIDLRNNAGGNLFAAIDSTMLFLANQEKIVSIKSRQDINNYESKSVRINSSSPLFLWQNTGTASAAEVFIAALTNNQRATSIGTNSFGKGTRQEIFELSDGSALVITTGFLQTPNGLHFDGIGLRPDYAIDSDNPKTADYMAKVKELLHEVNVGF